MAEEYEMTARRRVELLAAECSRKIIAQLRAELTEAEARAGRAEEAVKVLAELRNASQSSDLTRFVAAKKAVEHNPTACNALKG